MTETARDYEITARWDELEEQRKWARSDAEIKKIDREIAGLIRETFRLHPEDFTLCPDGRWRANKFVTKQ
jgi:hypothetical protein